MSFFMLDLGLQIRDIVSGFRIVSEHPGVADLSIDFAGAVTGAFQFEDQPWFVGFRALATNGVAKPVLNTFRMFGMMSGDRVEVTGGSGYGAMVIVEGSVREQTDVNAFGTRDERGAAVLVWNYHDDDLTARDAEVTVTVTGVPAGRVLPRHWPIDERHSNSSSA
ncbi:MAG: hypothetical protein P8188_12550 [Gemmatimonadota bacterium]